MSYVFNALNMHCIEHVLSVKIEVTKKLKKLQEKIIKKIVVKVTAPDKITPVANCSF